MGVSQVGYTFCLYLFELSLQAASLLLQLRQKWHSLFLRRMRAPSKPWSQVDEATIRAIIAVLSTEEQCAGLQQPSGIGQRPRPMSSEELPLASSWRSNNSRKTSADTEFSDESATAERYIYNILSKRGHFLQENELFLVESDVLIILKNCLECT